MRIFKPSQFAPHQVHLSLADRLDFVQTRKLVNELSFFKDLHLKLSAFAVFHFFPLPDMLRIEDFKRFLRNRLVCQRDEIGDSVFTAAVVKTIDLFISGIRNLFYIFTDFEMCIRDSPYKERDTAAEPVRWPANLRR